MFRFLYGMMAGQHEELPRRRYHDDPTFDGQHFTTAPPTPASDGDEWLRGHVPGQRAPESTEGLTVADEIKHLATQPRPPAT